MFEKILIVGLGLIGGSFAKYLRLKDQNVSIVAIDPDLETCQKAVQLNVVDQAVNKLDLLNQKQFDLVIVATPLNTIADMISSLSEILLEPCLFIDFGSTKSMLKESIKLKKIYHVYVGAHPLTGSHCTGYNNSSELLFEDAVMVITGSEKSAKERLLIWFKELSLNVIELSEEEHDKLLAMSSHIPYFMALLCLAPLRDLPHLQKKILSVLVAGGFKDTTRVSQSSRSWGLALCEQNAKEVLLALKVIRQHLDMLIDSIEQGDQYGLEVLIQVLSEQRQIVLPE